MSEDPNAPQNAMGAKLAANERQAGLRRSVANVKRELENLSENERNSRLAAAKLKIVYPPRREEKTHVGHLAI